MTRSAYWLKVTIGNDTIIGVEGYGSLTVFF